MIQRRRRSDEFVDDDSFTDGDAVVDAETVVDANSAADVDSSQWQVAYVVGANESSM